jgi:phosphatidylserine decarboxylase
VKFAREGYPFIGLFAAVTIVAFIALPVWMASFFLGLTLFMAYFFRDPDRTVPEEDAVFVAPADGKVVVLSREVESVFIKDRVLKISIFMSPLDVHVNRAPCDGRVEQVSHTPGRFMSAFKPEASVQNENIAMLLDTRFGKVLVRQIAGFLARRAVCRAKPGDTLRMGERFGMIKFSSRVDLFLPASTVPDVKQGDTVTAGESVLGHIR